MDNNIGYIYNITESVELLINLDLCNILVLVLLLHSLSNRLTKLFSY